MKVGDLVRFTLFKDVSIRPRLKSHLGILIEYEPWAKRVSVFHKGGVHRVEDHMVEKAGKKDYEAG